MTKKYPFFNGFFIFNVLKLINSRATNLYDEEEVLQAKLYELDKFNVLVCENDKKIIGNKDFDLTIDLCK